MNSYLYKYSIELKASSQGEFNMKYNFVCGHIYCELFLHLIKLLAFMVVKEFTCNVKIHVKNDRMRSLCNPLYWVVTWKSTKGSQYKELKKNGE